MSLTQIVAEKNQFEKLYFLNSACLSNARESERERKYCTRETERRSPLSDGATAALRRRVSARPR